MSDTADKIDEWKGVPIGRRFSLLYLDRGTGHSDSIRFRKRLYALTWEGLDYNVAQDIERNVGVTVGRLGNGYHWRDFIEKYRSSIF